MKDLNKVKKYETEPGGMEGAHKRSDSNFGNRSRESIKK